MTDERANEKIIESFVSAESEGFHIDIW
jgi:hypothetical protein